MQNSPNSISSPELRLLLLCTNTVYENTPTHCDGPASLRIHKISEQPSATDKQEGGRFCCHIVPEKGSGVKKKAIHTMFSRATLSFRIHCMFLRDAVQLHSVSAKHRLGGIHTCSRKNQQVFKILK